MNMREFFSPVVTRAHQLLQCHVTTGEKKPHAETTPRPLWHEAPSQAVRACGLFLEKKIVQ
jgi:hypothetical protein